MKRLKEGKYSSIKIYANYCSVTKPSRGPRKMLPLRREQTHLLEVGSVGDTPGASREDQMTEGADVGGRSWVCSTPNLFLLSVTPTRLAVCMLWISFIRK